MTDTYDLSNPASVADQLAAHADTFSQTNADDIAFAALIKAAADHLRTFIGDVDHVIEFRITHWTLQHPLACRPDLLSCPFTDEVVHDMVGRHTAPAPPGLYVLTLAEGGTPRFTARGVPGA